MHLIHKTTFKFLFQMVIWASRHSTTEVTGGEKDWSLIRRNASLLKSSFFDDQRNWLYDFLLSFRSNVRHCWRSVMVLTRISSKVETSSKQRGKPWVTHHAAKDGMYPGLRRILAFIYPFLDFEVPRIWNGFSGE